MVIAAATGAPLKLGIRGKLFVVSVLIVVGVDLAVGVYLGIQLEQSLTTRIETELTRHTLTAQDLIEATELDWRVETMDPLADRLGRSTGARVSLILPDGTLVGDSTLDGAELRAGTTVTGRFEDYLTTTDLSPSARNGTGHAAVTRPQMRYDEDTLYVWAPARHGDVVGIVRLAMPTHEIRSAVVRLRLLLALAGLLAVGLALLVGALSAHLISRMLRELLRTAKRTVETTGRVPIEADDELGGLAGTLNHLGEELQKTMATLAVERNRFETILQNMHEAVLAIDHQRDVDLANPAARRLLGLPENAEGRPLVDSVRIPALQDLIRGEAHSRPPSLEFDVNTGVPPTRRVLAHSTPLGTGGVVIVMHDITEIRRLETIRRDFVANVSHELRTPVSIIRANAETLLAGAMDQPEQARRFLEGVLRSADRLGRLISDLLDISRIEAGKYALEAKPLTLVPLFRRTIEASESQLRAKSLDVQFECEPSLRVLADAKGFDHVLSNLVDNAVKYTQAGGEIRVTGRRVGDDVRIEVIDNGPGIDSMHRPRIFERFYRVDPGRSRDMGGTGLGLAIVKHLVEAMRGRVGVEPRSPHGSVFWFTLPAAEERAPDA